MTSHLDDLSDSEAAYLAEVQELIQKEAQAGERCPANKPGKVTVKLANNARIYFNSQKEADKWLRDNGKRGYLSGIADALLGR